MLIKLEGMCQSAMPGQRQWPMQLTGDAREVGLNALPVTTGVCTCSLTFKEMDFVPYGDTLDGSARRAKYVKDLEAYLGSALQPILQAWEGELPAHLQKVCSS